MKGIFHPDKWNDWDDPLPDVQEIRKLDPVEDKYYLEYIVQHAYGPRQKTLMRKLGFSELPERSVNPEIPEDDQYEEYYVLRVQVAGGYEIRGHRIKSHTSEWSRRRRTEVVMQQAEPMRWVSVRHPSTVTLPINRIFWTRSSKPY